MATPNSSSTKQHFYVREPHGKRPAANEDDLQYQGPRAKKRFERVNSMLHDFSISSDKPFIVESSSDDDMGDSDISDHGSPAIVEEPEEPLTHVELDPSLKGYLERAKQAQHLLPSSLNTIRGDEVIVWRPMKSLNPFDDPNMVGRIQEVFDEEEDEEELKSVSDAGDVATPMTSDEEMSSGSLSVQRSPFIVELSDDDLRQRSPSDSSDSMDMEY